MARARPRRLPALMVAGGDSRPRVPSLLLLHEPTQELRRALAETQSSQSLAARLRQGGTGPRRHLPFSSSSSIWP